MCAHAQFNVLTLLFFHLKSFQILTFFDLWPLNGKSDKEVTVDTFACPFMCNKLTLLFCHEKEEEEEGEEEEEEELVMD